MRLQQKVLEVQLSPLTILLRAVLDQLQEKDQAKVFAQPVSLSEVSFCNSLELHLFKSGKVSCEC